MVKKISVLGSTGSIGVQTLDIAKRMNIEIRALAAGGNIDLLEKQIREFHPEIAAVFDVDKARELKDRLGKEKTRILSGQEGTIEAAVISDCDMVIAAIVGMAGLIPTLEAVKAGRRIGLANKETLVTAGHIIMREAEKNNIMMMPVDSEHSAIFQCLQGNSEKQVKRIILTASGGPFRGSSLEDIENATLEEALNHPNWNMGSKITIDSATLMNKGLEVIEAHHLFNMERQKIDVVVHPQSIVHSMVEYIDGSIIAQLGMPDMRGPIQYAITYPDRRDDFSESIDFMKLSRLEFQMPDLKVFRCLGLAFNALEEGETMPVVLNASNEIAVDYFLKGMVKFNKIPDIIENVMERHSIIRNPDLEDIIHTDKEARSRTIETIERNDYS